MGLNGSVMLWLLLMVAGVAKAAVFNVNAVLNTGRSLAGLSPAEDLPIVSELLLQFPLKKTKNKILKIISASRKMLICLSLIKNRNWLHFIRDVAH